MSDKNRHYQARRNPGYLMINPELFPHGIKRAGDRIPGARVGEHVTLHIQCDHWWTLAEAQVCYRGFDITETVLRQCSNLSESDLNRLIRQRKMSEPLADSSPSAPHRAHGWESYVLRIDRFDGEQTSIGTLPHQARLGDQIWVRHWGYFFSIWPDGATRKDADCPQEIYEEGSMRTTFTRPPPGSTVH